MLKKKYFILPIISIVILVLFLTSCGSKTKISIGTGSKAGNYYSYATNLGDAVEDDSKYSLKVVETAGSRENLNLLSEGKLDMALVQSDILKDSTLEGFHTVTSLYVESIQVIVPAGSSITSINDLRGKKVSIGEVDGGTISNAKDVLNAYSIDESEMTVSNLSFTASTEALKNGLIDAFFMTSSYPTKSLVDLANNYSFRFLNVDYSLLDNTRYEKSVIPAGTYAGQTEAIETIGVSCILVASDKLNKKAESKITDIVKEHNSDIQKISFGIATSVKKDTRKKLKLDMYLTLGIAVIALYIGAFLRRKIKFFEKFCIPAPVIGGLIFAIVSCILYASGLVEFVFDETLKSVCMIIFFTSVGFQADLKVLKKGGVSLVLFLLCVIVLIFLQNGVAVGVAKVMHVSEYMGLSTGSISMVGGHGTAGAFGTVLEDLGEGGATTLCTTAATFGLIAGSLMGGPVGNRLIRRHDLTKKMNDTDDTVLIQEDNKHKRAGKYAQAAYMIAIAMGIGTIVSYLLSKTGMTFPVYIGAMIVAAIIRNTSEFSGKFEIHMGEINDLGGICLSLFLGIAMVTLKLWQLAAVALPLLVLLLAQTALMLIYVNFVVYNVMGRNYDAAVLAAGTCGFGMGATPNAMANMQAVTQKYGPSIQAFILVPIVGSMFADFINSLVITLFLNIF